MGEFWMGKELYESWVGESPPGESGNGFGGHVYGRPIIGAEAFTAVPRTRNGSTTPSGSRCWRHHVHAGHQRFIFHRYALQPWLDRQPGMTSGSMESTSSAPIPGGAVHRVAGLPGALPVLLQQGRFVADVAYLASEKGSNQAPGRETLDPPMPAGYDYDALPRSYCSAKPRWKMDGSPCAAA